jgi:hypothetical protein
VNANITNSSGGAAVVLRADNTGTGTGTVSFASSSVKVTTAGAVSIFYNPSGNDNATVNVTSYTNPTSYNDNIAGGGTMTSYMLVNTVYDLQNVQNNLSGNYALGRDIDASSTATWNGLAGFAPIGGNTGFSGLFDGKNHTINGLTMAPTTAGTFGVGLFGALRSGAVVRDLALTNVDITANPNAGSGTQAIGALVGFNGGTIQNVTASGSIAGGTVQSISVGGLVGENALFNGIATNPGTILSSAAAVSITLGDGNVCFALCFRQEAGGLVGMNAGTISNSSATGNITVGANSQAGGLVASNASFTNAVSPPTPSITGSFATGTVTGGSGSLVGGFVGITSGTLTNVSATGNVTGGGNSLIGGIAGAVVPPHTGVASITNGVYSGAVASTGSGSAVGGVVGFNAGVLIGGSASGSVAGTSGSFLGGVVGINLGLIDPVGPATVTGTGSNNVVGGVAGLNLGLISDTNSTSDVTSGANSLVGGLVGANAAFINIPAGQLSYSTFPTGTIVNSTASGNTSGGSGSTVDSQVGASNPTTLPTAYPTLLTSCTHAVCDIFRTGVLGTPSTGPDTGGDVTIPDPYGIKLILDAPPPNRPDPLKLVLVSLNTPDPGAPGARPAGPAAGAVRSYAPPPVPRPVMGPDGERFSSMPPVGETRFINNEVVLQVNLSLTAEQIEALMRELGLRVIASQNLTTFGRMALRLQLPGGMTVRQAIAALERKNFVVVAQPNYVYNVPPPGAPSPGDPAQYMVNKLQLEEVHRLATGRNVTVAVIDSEVDRRHTEIASVISGAFDAVGAGEKAHSHGTAMVGAIASRNRLVGVAPNARILAVRAFGETAASAEGTSFNIVRGIEWAVAQGARVINMSFAGPHDPALQRALKMAADKGVVLVAAVGNAGPKSPPLFPGADNNVISVTATDSDDKLFRQANQGGYVTIASPGVEILAPAPGEAYQMSTGTSIATAHISGVVALMLERDPSLTPAQIKQILESTATDLGAKGKDPLYGWGLVNPVKALAAVDARKKTPIVTAPPR